ncbi:cupin domain-containing protein [Serratia oryzae]|uniref:Cupin n=1 Tax=Serratia oryzae TaxID=2034155 RepID=A0A1S8CQ96_9GAMM|nr:cupin domain-containing protein [Serratia oryzae]OMQ27060.1 cupin [Serratia oryzae]
MNVFRKMNWDTLIHEYDLDGSRLLPWDGMNAPFGGAWCVVHPGTESRRHSHDEYELFIAIHGHAEVRIGERFIEAEKGDLVLLPLNTEHSVRNNSNEDFHFYSIWWDKKSASQFLNKLEEQ